MMRYFIAIIFFLTALPLFAQTESLFGAWKGLAASTADRALDEPPAPSGGNPLVRPRGVNPLAKPRPDPWLREFTGDEIALRLVGSAEAGYSGSLQVAGRTYPMTGRLSAGKLVGSFRAGDQPFEFEATLEGDLLLLLSGGSEHRLQAKATPQNPLSPKPAKAPDEAAVGLGGPRWQHPSGWFSFEMPQGWSVWRELDDGILLNPGLTESDSLDALIFLSYSRLEEDERGLGVDALIRKGEPKLAQQLAEQGIQVDTALQPPELVRVGKTPGAIQTWRGRAQSGSKVDVWLGALVEGDSSLALVAILVDGKGSRFQPQIQNVFRTLRATPPRSDASLLAGRSFSHSSVYPGSGSFHTIYEFRADGTVRKQMILSGGEVGGNTDEIGRYEVVGDQVTLRFSDVTSTGRLIVERDSLRALQFGNSRYRPR